MDDLIQQELEAEFNARYDYLSEAYGATARDAAMMAEDDARAEREEAIEERMATGLSRDEAIAAMRADFERAEAEWQAKLAAGTAYGECPF